jgi:hypothetical protein
LGNGFLALWEVAGILLPYWRKGEWERGEWVGNPFLEAGFSGSRSHVCWVIHKSCMNFGFSFLVWLGAEVGELLRFFVYSPLI